MAKTPESPSDRTYGDTHHERVRELIETGKSVRQTGPGILQALREALDPENDPEVKKS